MLKQSSGVWAHGWAAPPSVTTATSKPASPIPALFETRPTAAEITAKKSAAEGTNQPADKPAKPSAGKPTKQPVKSNEPAQGVKSKQTQALNSNKWSFGNDELSSDQFSLNLFIGIIGCLTPTSSRLQAIGALMTLSNLSFHFLQPHPPKS